MGGYVSFGVLTSILLIIGGIITALVGKFLLRLVIGIAAGGLLAYLIAKLVLMMNGGLMAAVVLGALGFIIGFFLGWFIMKLALSIITGIAVGIVVANMLGFMGNIGLLLLIVLISIGISYLLSEKIISLIVIAAGAAMIYLGLLSFVTQTIAAVVAVIIIILVLVLKHKK